MYCICLFYGKISCCKSSRVSRRSAIDLRHYTLCHVSWPALMDEHCYFPCKYSFKEVKSHNRQNLLGLNVSIWIVKNFWYFPKYCPRHLSQMSYFVSSYNFWLLTSRFLFHSLWYTISMPLSLHIGSLGLVQSSQIQSRTLLSSSRKTLYPVTAHQNVRIPFYPPNNSRWPLRFFNLVWDVLYAAPRKATQKSAQ